MSAAPTENANAYRAMRPDAIMISSPYRVSTGTYHAQRGTARRNAAQIVAFADETTEKERA
jgi:hypothetical protein